MATRDIGGVTYTIREIENYLGQQYIVVADVLPADMATLGMPENVQVFVMSASVLYRWNGTAWVNFYASSTPGPANALTIGTVTTLAAGASATATIAGSAPNQTLSLGIPKGSNGANGTNGTNGTNGAANSLSIGSVTALAAGASPTATISGTAPSQTLSLGIPAGANGTNGTNGANGSNGPANSLSIGTVSALAAGAAPTATITGSAPAQTLNLGIPSGAAGSNGTNGTNGTNGVGIAPSAPAAMTVVFATAYQVADPTKAAHINIMLESNYMTTLAGTSADEVEVRIGPTNAVATGGGSQVATWKTSLTGIALTVGLGLIQRNPVAFMLPIGWYFSVRRLSGTTAIISSTAVQPLG